MIFVQAIRDRYKASSDTAQGDPSGRGGGSQNFIRRPTNGIQIKEDTFATIRVVAAENGGNRLLVDAGSRRVDPKTQEVMEIDGKRATDIYSNFLLQQVQEDRMEKQQILETFGESYIFLFGQRARVITFQGILANTFDFNWEAEWWHNYEEYLRGTRCVENDARVYISYDNTLVGGYIISTSSAKDTMNKNHVSFTFQLFVTYYGNFSSIGDPSAFSGDGVHAISRSVDLSFTADELQQSRPALLSDRIPTQSTPLVGSGEVTSLFDSLEAGVAQAKDAWGKAQQVVNSAIDQVSGFLNPDGGVRIPIGFAGSMVFADENELVTNHESTGAITKYSTFDKNDQEYVGVSDQYGSSTWSLGNGAGLWEKENEFEYGQRMVNAANAAWTAKGYKIPDSALGPVSQFLVSKTLGLAAVGATAAWQAASTALQAGSADPANFAHPAVPVTPSAPIE